MRREAGAATRRLFFALWPDEAQRSALEHAVVKAVRRCGGRPVPAANLHVTLAFLGSVALARIPELQSIARELTSAARLERPVRLSFTRLVHWKEAQILCALGTPESASARELAAALKQALNGAGFSPDLKPFQAHITLARKVARPGTLAPLRPLEWCFDRFALIDSRTEPSGPVYSVIESYPLGAG